MENLKEKIKEAIKVKEAVLEDRDLLYTVVQISDLLIKTFKNKNKVLFCGNGGSAADAQHLAAELSGKFYFDRPALNAEALHVNTSFLTAVANDYSYDNTFSRLIEAKGNEGDVLIAISTSGNSANVINTLKTAKKLDIVTVGFAGASGGKMAGLCDFLIKVPSQDTARIQEMHILFGHLICERVEKTLFAK